MRMPIKEHLQEVCSPRPSELDVTFFLFFWLAKRAGESAVTVQQSIWHIEAL
jgi:hypothetical protein